MDWLLKNRIRVIGFSNDRLDPRDEGADERHRDVFEKASSRIEIFYSKRL
jgi:hypothetical protein